MVSGPIHSLAVNVHTTPRDTVASVGVIYGRNLPFTSSNSAVRIFRHALSLDEVFDYTRIAPHISLTWTFKHRARFQPNMFHRESPQDADKRKKDPSLPVEAESIPPGQSPPVEVLSDSFPPVLEVWFAGCHSDVGGGAVDDDVRYSLADISLRWMVKQVILSQSGIKFDEIALRRAEIDVSTVILVAPTKPNVELEVEVGPALPTPLTSPGEDGSGEDMIRKGQNNDVGDQSWPRQQDVLADIHDQMKRQPLWWFLEFLPMKTTWQEADGTWKSEWGYAFMKLHPLRPTLPDLRALY